MACLFTRPITFGLNTFNCSMFSHLTYFPKALQRELEAINHISHYHAKLDRSRCSLIRILTRWSSMTRSTTSLMASSTGSAAITKCSTVAANCVKRTKCNEVLVRRRGQFPHHKMLIF